MIMKKLVGQVTPEEKNEIQMLFERRNGLNELAKILTADNSDLYEEYVLQHDSELTGESESSQDARSLEAYLTNLSCGKFASHGYVAGEHFRQE